MLEGLSHSQPSRLDTLQTIELAEGVEIRLRPAGPYLRMLAFALDFAIRVGLVVAIAIVMGVAGLAVGEQVAAGFYLIAWFLISWFYHVLFERGRRGATPGKRVVGLRVVQQSGAPITLGQAVVRNFLRFVDGLPPGSYGFGLVACLLTERFQRLGDLAAATVVVYERAPRELHVPMPPPVAAHPPRVWLSPEEQRALVAFRERAALWSDPRRIELANLLEPLTGATGPTGVARLLATGHAIQQQRQDAI